ncbi:MAG: hypothetical protein FJY60_01290 [Betaproteobacteria bacterium]|nr:hypothetical protein [Betaproteobacteria bacterium]
MKHASTDTNQLFMRMVNLLRISRNQGVTFAPISSIDYYLDKCLPAVFLKHDVHYVRPELLLRLAEQEAELEITGTYFFMPFGHPLSSRHFSTAEQTGLMRKIAKLGHEVGLHFDPYHALFEQKFTVRDALTDEIVRFSDITGESCVANLHGNSRYKLQDVEGASLVYEFFEELSRQRDFPALMNVPDEHAELFRRERISLQQTGISHWGDTWIWSACSGLVATNLISDNAMKADNSLSVTLNRNKPCAYGLNPSMKSRFFDGQTTADWLSLSRQLPSAYLPRSVNLNINGPETEDYFMNVIPVAPFVMLLHPQFYCV